MTIRSVLLGLLVAVALASVGYVHDIWLAFPSIGGNLMPGYAFGLLTLAVVLVNPLLRRLGGWQFTSGELVVMLSLVLMGCVIAGSGLMWVFPHQIINPVMDMASNPGWREADLLRYTPEVMLVQPGGDGAVLSNFVRGLGQPGRPAAWTDVSWPAWAPTLTFWAALLGLSFVAGLAAVVVVARQWGQREHLTFPLARVTGSLLEPPGEGRLLNDLFRDRRFWIGSAISLGVLLLNGLSAWRPGVPAVPLNVNLYGFKEILGVFGNVPWVNVLDVRFYFAAVGLAYFLTSEASLSLGLSGWLYVLVAAPLVVAGVDMNTDVLTGGLPAWMYFGAYMGLAAMTLYLGRRFYAAVAGRAFFLPVGRVDVLPREAWAARVCILASAAMVALLAAVGLHPALGVAFVLLAGVYFLMIGRINVSTGLFIIQPFWQPVAVLAALFGAEAMGPQAVIILAMLCAMLTIDPRIAAVPLALNAVHLGQANRVNPARLTGWMGAAIVLAAAVAMPVTVYTFYRLGSSHMDSAGSRWAQVVANMPFDMLASSVEKLDSTDTLRNAAEPPTLKRLAGGLTFRSAESRRLATGAAVGFALVVGCSVLRLRFPRWPLHPVVFLVWGTRWTTEFAPSFLLAWAIKSAITRFGGMNSYKRLRPFFIGLMAGEFVATVFWGLFGISYYFLTGEIGRSFRIRP